MTAESSILEFLSNHEGPCTYGHLSLSLPDYDFQDICATIERLCADGIVLSDFQGVRLAKQSEKPSLANEVDNAEQSDDCGRNEQTACTFTQDEKPNEEGRRQSGLANAELGIAAERDEQVDIFADDYMIGAASSGSETEYAQLSLDELSDLLHSSGITSSILSGLDEYSNEPLIGASEATDNESEEKPEEEEAEEDRRWHALDPISSLPLLARTKTALHKAGLKSVEDLVNSLTATPSYRGVGVAGYESIISVLTGGSQPLAQKSTRDQAIALGEISGSFLYSFDAFGFLLLLELGDDEYDSQFSVMPIAEDPKPKSAYIGIVEQYADSPISILNLTTPTEKRLRQHGYATVGQLARATEEELLGLRHIGAHKVQEIFDALESFSETHGGYEAPDTSCNTPPNDVSERTNEPNRLDVYAPIEILGLSDPVTRRLKQYSYYTVSDLLCSTEDELLSLRHIGIGKVREIRKALERFSTWKAAESFASELGAQPIAVESYLESFSTEARDAADYAFLLLDDKYPVFEKTFFVYILPIIRSLIEEGDVDLAHCAESLEEIFLEAGIIEKACVREFDRKLNKALIQERFHKLSSPTPVPQFEPWVKAAKSISEHYEWCIYNEEEHCIEILHLRVTEWLETLSPRTAAMLRMRLKGLTLDDCGRKYRITRSRAQQICNKALAERPILYEDRYARFFEMYELDAKSFSQIFGSTPKAFRYLEMTSKSPTAQKKSLHEALLDDDVSQSIKTAIKKKLDEGYVYESDVRIHVDKRSITEYLIERHAADRYVTVEFLINQYEAFLSKHELAITKSLVIKNARSYEAFLDRMDVVIRLPHSVISNYGGNIRYYNPDSYDYSLLVQTIIATSNANIECSTMLLMQNESVREAAELYDIRNGYELHYVLNRFCNDAKEFEVGHVPMVVFGSGDRKRQIIDLIEELGPISGRGLAEAYEQRYGVDRKSFQGTYLKGFEIYKHNGKYSHSRASLTREQESFLRSQLIDDYVSLPVLKARFEDKFPDASPSVINDRSISKLGYKPAGKLLIRSRLEPRNLFSKLLDSTSRFALGDPGFPSELFDNSDFLAELRSRQNALSIIEYKKNSYIQTSELKRLDEPITKNLLADFIDKALDFMKHNRPYSIKSLINEGFGHPVIDRFDAVGFGDYALSSVLGTAYVGSRLKKTAINEVPIFCRTRYSFSVPDIFDSILEEEEYFEIDEFCDYVNDRFGVDMSMSLARATAKRSQLYFNESLDTIFLNKDVYREKVSEWIC